MSSIRIDTDLDGYLRRITAIDTVPSAIAVLDMQGTPAYQNPAFQTLNRNLRDSEENLHTQSAMLDCPPVKDWAMASLDSPTVEQLHQRFFYSRHIHVDLTLVSTPILDADHHVVGRMLTIGEESIEFDNHHLARSQDSQQALRNRILTLDQERRQHERLIRILLRNAPFAMMILNEQQQVIQTNSMAERLFGLTTSQMIGSHLSKVVDCQPRQYSSENQSSHSDGNHGELIDLPDQDLVLLRSTETLEDADQTLIIEAFVDITSMKKAEREIERLNDLNTLLIDSTGEGIFSIDNAFNCTFINQAACRMLDYQADELIGRSIKLFSGDDDIRHINNTGFTSSDSTRHIDTTFVSKSGQSLPVQYLCSPLHKNGVTRGAVIVFRDVSEARLTARKLDYMATHDMLTGLLNRYAFEIKLSHLLEDTDISRSSHILCYIDLDQFKVINDTSGHTAGDELLKQISNVIQTHIRKSDALARLGGDEFGILLVDCDIDKARDIVSHILDDVLEFRFSWDDKIFTVGASIGLVKLSSSLNEITTAMQAADSACYIAKVNGRRRIHVYEQDDASIRQHQLDLAWVNRIKESLQRNLFVLWQQPIVAIDSPVQKQHLEILIRMHDQNNELILPGSFIPTAERYGLMADIDRWVINEVIRLLSDQPLDNIDRWCINVSGQSLSDELFISFIHDAFNEHQDLARHICFEITETAAISNLTRVSDFMREIRDMGFTFSLDDFGSGMSSFGYLRNLPVDYLKIDGNFIRNIETDSIDRAMVEAIHRIGRIMNIKTVAEYVERESIMHILRDIGIDYAQGYGIGRPVPVVDS